MAFRNDYEQEMHRADDHERELEQRLSMQDGISSPGSYYAPAPIQQVPQVAYRRSSPNLIDQRRAMGAKVFRVVCAVFWMVALTLLVIMMEIVDQMNDKYKRCTAVAQAEVVDNILSSDGGGFRSVYTFKDLSGTHVFMDSVAARPARHQIGDKVQLHYNPNNYKEFYVEQSKRLIIIILSSIAGFFALLGTVMGIVGAKLKKNSGSGTNTWQ